MFVRTLMLAVLVQLFLMFLEYPLWRCLLTQHCSEDYGGIADGYIEWTGVPVGGGIAVMWLFLAMVLRIMPLVVVVV